MSRKGIVDPWKVVEPLQKPARQSVPRPTRINLDQIDFDEDIRTARSYVFRSQQGSISVSSKDIQTASDALVVLVSCLFQVLEEEDGPDLFDEANIGFSLDGREWNLPSKETLATRHETPPNYPRRTALYFLRQRHDAGMLRLVQLLQRIKKRPGAAGEFILQRWGVTPMSR